MMVRYDVLWIIVRGYRGRCAQVCAHACACVCVCVCACVCVRACKGYNLDNLVKTMKLGGTVPFKLPVLKSLRTTPQKSNDVIHARPLSVTHARLTVLATPRGS
jgi:hypothetical protein